MVWKELPEEVTDFLGFAEAKEAILVLLRLTAEVDQVLYCHFRIEDALLVATLILENFVNAVLPLRFEDAVAKGLVLLGLGV